VSWQQADRQQGCAAQRVHAEHTQVQSTDEKEQQINSISVGVISAKGGAGATTLALNLALALAKSQCSTTLLDANLQQPDLALLAGGEPEHSLLEFLARAEKLDETIYQACSLQLTTEPAFARCALLSGAANGEAATQTNLTQIAAAITALETKTECVLVDLPKNLDRHLVTMLDRLDLLVLVFEGTLASVAATRRWLRLFAELGYPASKLLLVLNRSGSKTQGIEADLNNLLAGKEVHRIPNAFQLVEECSASGQAALLKNPRDKYSIAVSRLATVIQEIRQAKTNSNRKDK
jgi:pilus assembly protein CpaE